MKAEGIETYIDYLLNKSMKNQANRSVFVVVLHASIIVSGLQDRNDIQAVNAKRHGIIDQLGALIRNGSIPKNDEWIQSILDWFIVNGFFSIKKKSDKSPLPCRKWRHLFLSVLSLHQ